MGGSSSRIYDQRTSQFVLKRSYTLVGDNRRVRAFRGRHRLPEALQLFYEAVLSRL